MVQVFDVLQYLVCPACGDGGALEPVDSVADSTDSSRSAALSCQTCSRRYPIINGICDMLLDDSLAIDHLQDEVRQWDGMADLYDQSRQDDQVYTASIEAVVSCLKLDRNDVVLDVACGTGMTVMRYIRRCGMAVCCDISARSLHILQAKLQHAGLAALLVRADVCALPFRSNAFDRVVCANALQHLPGDKSRRQGIEQLVHVLSDRGQLVLSTHNFSEGKRRAGWSKEKHQAGSHSGSVQYIYRYESDEFRRVLEDYVTVDRLLGAGLPFKYRFGLGPVFRQAERILRGTSYGIERGHMLVAACRKRPQIIPEISQPD